MLAPEMLCWALQVKAAKLDIKKDPKGVVTVPGATVVEITSAKALLMAIERWGPATLRTHLLLCVLASAI